jgi:tRNA dimethylallyltransferase
LSKLNRSKYNLITILGPTATGKTKLSVQLAYYFKGEIISADSRQVYRGMNIGTGKDLSDYKINGNYIPYFLINVIGPKDEFDLYKFQQLFYESFNNIQNRNKLPFLVGGTGLYLSSILQFYNLSKANFENEKQLLSSFSDDELINTLRLLNPNLHNTTDLADRERIIKAITINKTQRKNKNQNQINSFNIGVTLPRVEIKNRITARLKKRLDTEGMIDMIR